MKNHTQVFQIKLLPLLILVLLFSNCGKDKKGCDVVSADFSPEFLDHAGMAPERVRFKGDDPSADTYIWNIEGVMIEKPQETVTFGVSGSYDASLTAKKGGEQCSESTIIKITPFPSVGSNRAISYFESDGTLSKLKAKVIDTNSEILTAIDSLPEQGGGMDVDNEGKKIFACPFALLASCYPNNEDLAAPVPKDMIPGTFFDLTLDPNDETVFFTILNGNNFSIKSTDMYNDNSMNIDNVYSENINADFIYITNDRENNVLYWVEKGGEWLKRFKNGVNAEVLTFPGNVFGDIEYDDTNNRLYCVLKSGGSSFITSIKTSDFSDPIVETNTIIGDIPFIFIDEDRQELFWAEDTQKTISSKRIGFPTSDTQVLISNLGPIRGLTVGFYGD